MLIHLSDLHIGRGFKETRMAKKLVAEISKLYPKVPVIISGDITDSGARCQCRKARSILKDLSKTNPVLPVPGNHDYNWFGIIGKPKANRTWKEYLGTPHGWKEERGNWLGPEQDPKGIDGIGIWHYNDIVFIGIDTGDPNDEVGTAEGYVSEVQRNALLRALQIHSVNKMRVVILHHHPFQRTIGLKLKGADALMKVLGGNCELLLFGHKHRFETWSNYKNIPHIISSHKSTAEQYGGKLEYIVIRAQDPGKPNMRISHFLEKFNV